ncbi:MAG TPA: zf-HC2 domain-containing protein [Actinomycetota bacterium]|nr:zf-HC2 domain-containing protein [Actinomycetota bacterium]
MTCRDLVEIATDYLDGALDPDERARLDRHLQTCPGCRNYLAQLARVVELTGTFPKDDVDPAVVAALASVFRAWREEGSV